jgi:hypothetical protein
MSEQLEIIFQEILRTNSCDSESRQNDNSEAPALSRKVILFPTSNRIVGCTSSPTLLERLRRLGEFDW